MKVQTRLAPDPIFYLNKSGRKTVNQALLLVADWEFAQIQTRLLRLYQDYAKGACVLKMLSPEFPDCAYPRPPPGGTASDEICEKKTYLWSLYSCYASAAITVYWLTWAHYWPASSKYIWQVKDTGTFALSGEVYQEIVVQVSTARKMARW